MWTRFTSGSGKQKPRPAKQTGAVTLVRVSYNLWLTDMREPRACSVEERTHAHANTHAGLRVSSDHALTFKVQNKMPGKQNARKTKCPENKMPGRNEPPGVRDLAFV
jgi:hypothetical protein